MALLRVALRGSFGLLFQRGIQLFSRRVPGDAWWLFILNLKFEVLYCRRYPPLVFHLHSISRVTFVTTIR